jgi:hypothetical protein
MANEKIVKLSHKDGTLQAFGDAVRAVNDGKLTRDEMYKRYDARLVDAALPEVEAEE